MRAAFVLSDISRLLGEGGIKVQHKWIGIGAEFGNDESNSLRHQPGDERDVAGEAVELGDKDRALRRAVKGEGGRELWAACEAAPAN